MLSDYWKRQILLKQDRKRADDRVENYFTQMQASSRINANFQAPRPIPNPKRKHPKSTREQKDVYSKMSE